MAPGHPNARLEAFCDGVFAIAATLLVVDLRVPATQRVDSAATLWLELLRLGPALLAFILSFTVIFITWMNHHATLKLIDESSPWFVYANGFLLLTVAFVPFPTTLLGEYVSSSNATPAVAVYNAVLAAQGAAWVLVCRTAVAKGLATNDRTAATLRMNGRYGFGALVLYSLLAVMALWLPHVAVGITAATWVFWLIHGARLKAA
jgi:uncharacterized membrane protein